MTEVAMIQPAQSSARDGAMQSYGLTLDKFLRHAGKWHPAQTVATATGANSSDHISYADVERRALAISRLLQGMGVGLGSRVATLAWNTSAHLEAWYAIMGMGATCHTLNPRLTAGQTAEMLGRSGAEILIAAADLLPLARDIASHAPELTHVLVIDGEQSGLGFRPNLEIRQLDPEAIPAGGPEVEWGLFDEETASGLCFTSGTTGAPKGVTYTHRSGYLHTLRMLQADVFGITAEDTVLPVVPMFHANGWGIPFAAPAVGAKLVLPGRHADGQSLADLIEREGVTVAAGVPTVWLGLADYLEASGRKLPTIRRIMVGGSPLAPALMDRLEKQIGVTIQTSWGMTELSPSGTVAPPDLAERNSSQSGRPALGVDLVLMDRDGKQLPEQRNVEGHLHVRGASVIERYLGSDTPAVDADGWFDTGDLARIDAQGNLTITGRSKDLIKSGGEWINPAEIEAIVGGMPEVSLAAVIARADEKWGERPLLIVEPRKGITIPDEAFAEAMRDRIASWWIPREIIRVENMPMASTGKIDKIRLKAEYGHA